MWSLEVSTLLLITQVSNGFKVNEILIWPLKNPVSTYRSNSMIIKCLALCSHRGTYAYGRTTIGAPIMHHSKLMQCNARMEIQTA